MSFLRIDKDFYPAVWYQESSIGKIVLDIWRRENFPSWKDCIGNLVSQKISQVGKIVSKIWCFLEKILHFALRTSGVRSSGCYL